MSTPPRSATPATDSTPTGAAAAGAAGAAEHGDGAAPASTGPPSGGGGESSAAKARGLDDEVASLVGGFTSFWGKVKKQVRRAFYLFIAAIRLSITASTRRGGRDAAQPRETRQVGERHTLSTAHASRQKDTSTLLS